MRNTAAERRSSRRATRLTALAVAAVAAVGAGVTLHSSASFSVPFFGDVLGSDSGGTPTGDDGVLPDGATVLDEHHPGVANLDPDLLEALRQATLAAGDVGIRLSLTSGWRSPAYQDQLLREAVAEYGTAEEAARWVATAATSPHVSGNAVDIGSFDAIAWLSEHGPEYGLCQIYSNEVWHYEFRPEAAQLGCPAMYADPTQDPRMQR